MSNRNNGQKTEGRNPDGTFAPGNPGKPKGSRHRTTLALEGIMDGEAEALGRKAIELALQGDTVALRLCLERVLPPRKDAPVEFALPDVANAAGAATAAQAVLQAVSDGDLSPTDASVVMALVERYGRVLQMSDLEGRIEALERASGATRR